jgi:hypothetical protein
MQLKILTLHTATPNFRPVVFHRHGENAVLREVVLAVLCCLVPRFECMHMLQPLMQVGRHEQAEAGWLHRFGA